MPRHPSSSPRVSLTNSLRVRDPPLSLSSRWNMSIARSTPLPMKKRASWEISMRKKWEARGGTRGGRQRQREGRGWNRKKSDEG
eukprot:433811-Hanusia_phi.AAC.1